MYMGSRACAVIEENCDDLKLAALFSRHQMVHVHRAFKVLGVGRPGFRFVGFRELHLCCLAKSRPVILLPAAI
jgi:hypothetical protein